jgi:hypothetical protein
MRYSGIEIEKVRTQSPGTLQVRGYVTTTTVGTIDATKTNIPKTGRYTITLVPPTAESVATLANLTLLGGYATLIGPPDVAMTAAKGIVSIFRQDDISQTSPSGTSAKDGTIELQWIRPDTYVDAEVQDAATFYFCIDLGAPQVT